MRCSLKYYLDSSLGLELLFSSNKGLYPVTLLFPIPGRRCVHAGICVYIYKYLFWAKALREGGGTKGCAMLSTGEGLLGDAVSTETLHFPLLALFFPHLHLRAGPMKSLFGVIRGWFLSSWSTNEVFPLCLLSAPIIDTPLLMSWIKKNKNQTTNPRLVPSKAKTILPLNLQKRHKMQLSA